MSKHRLIAINLPQFHPFKENDEWWGKGFTEWTNVTKAKPRFLGHYQPQLPTETGFYDMRLPETREMQANMARDAGIYGFCYYHYWFNGKQLMERPIQEILSSGKPDFPFMLCWANENWSRNWDGGNKEILIAQDYSPEDDIQHMRYLCENVFPDKRYIRVDGKPFFVIYRPSLLPNMSKTLDRWRSVAKRYGLELYIGYMRSWDIADEEIMKQGFDAHVDFQPRTDKSHPYQYFADKKSWFKYRAHNKLSEIFLNKTLVRDENLYDYSVYIADRLARPSTNYKEFPGVTPGWDNSSRRVGLPFWAFINNTPELYGEWLKAELERFEPYSRDENFLFINAWNEWAEGNHLEPDDKWGRAFLDKTKEIAESDI